MLKVRIKYCGGCNPYYDRVALVKRIESRLQGEVEFVSTEIDGVDLILAVEGCQTACADLESYQGKTIYIISRFEDAAKFLQKIQNRQFGIGESPNSRPYGWDHTSPVSTVSQKRGVCLSC